MLCMHNVSHPNPCTLSLVFEHQTSRRSSLAGVERADLGCLEVDGHCAFSVKESAVLQFDAALVNDCRCPATWEFLGAALAEEAYSAQKEVAKLRAELALAKSAALAEGAAITAGGARVVVSRLDGIDSKPLQVRASTHVPPPSHHSCHTLCLVKYMAFACGMQRFGGVGSQHAVGKVGAGCKCVPVFLPYTTGTRHSLDMILAKSATDTIMCAFA